MTETRTDADLSRYCFKSSLAQTPDTIPHLEETVTSLIGQRNGVGFQFSDRALEKIDNWVGFVETTHPPGKALESSSQSLRQTLSQEIGKHYGGNDQKLLNEVSEQLTNFLREQATSERNQMSHR